MYSPQQVLRLDSNISDTKKMFTETNYSCLPVLNEDDKLIGVVKIKDILMLTDDRGGILPYISKDYISIQRPNAAHNIIETYYSNPGEHLEIFITDFDGRLVDVVNMLSYVRNVIQSTETMNEEQFLKQIIRPTSLARCILDGLNDAVILVDKNSRIIYANKAYADILGIDVQKLLDRFLSEIEPEAKILGVLKTEESVVGKIINIKSLGSLIMANITPIKFREKLVGAISVFSDITKITNIANELERMKIINKLLAQEMKSDQRLPESFKGIVGNSVVLRKQLTLAAKIASVESSVLILGESGTGKELLAKAIHEASSRKNGPFVVVNCAAIPDNLLESELFGYDEGAFTGAKKGGKIGKFEQAHGGTLFLDEIGDMPLIMQTKLLRILQDKELNKVGGVNSIKVDFRLLTATNKNLSEMVEQNKFREDLFYRINVFTIKIPPLRERRIDIFNLIEYYKRFYEQTYNKQINISSECLKILLNYNWPGNIRELKNVVEHIVVMTNNIVTLDNLPEYLKAPDLNEKTEKVDTTVLKPLYSKMKDVEKTTILDALIQADNNKTKAMKLLGISRRTFYKKLKELNI